MHICGADRHGGRSDTDSRESGILEELRLEDAVRNPQRSARSFDVLLYEWIRREPRITLLLDTSCYAAEMNGHRIRAIHAVRPSTEVLVLTPNSSSRIANANSAIPKTPSCLASTAVVTIVCA